MEMFPPIVGSSDLYTSFKLSFNHFINFFFKFPRFFIFFSLSTPNISLCGHYVISRLLPVKFVILEDPKYHYEQ